ncbi:hypothetical protein MNBD_CHLOROFLEXI01-1010 [hydrothermal vent metagenome]|uniref:Uncharacterized protein n=1 Tax=hydrothermal vent metagenome TaxID=652676 RepID=A0A3B0UQA0_9ZZZZ
MSKLKWQHLASAFLLSSVLLFFMTIVTYASNYKTQSFAGDTATALKVNTTLSPGLTWRAEIYSDMYDNTVIDRIGWSSWRAYEKCNGIVISQTFLTPVSAPNVAHQSRVYDQLFQGCSQGTKRIGHNGNHEYKEGGNTIYLDTVAESGF